MPDPPRRASVEGPLSLLHWVAGVSYFKAALPHTISCESGTPGPAAAALLEALYSAGLGELAYGNGLAALPRPRFPRAAPGYDGPAAPARAEEGSWRGGGAEGGRRGGGRARGGVLGAAGGLRGGDRASLRGARALSRRLHQLQRDLPPGPRPAVLLLVPRLPEVPVRVPGDGSLQRARPHARDLRRRPARRRAPVRGLRAARPERRAQPLRVRRAGDAA